MDDDAHCPTCDGRYCGSTCTAQPGWVWVVGYGWESPSRAQDLELIRQATVHWDSPWRG